MLFINRYALAALVPAWLILAAASFGFAQDYKGLIEQKEEGASSGDGGYAGLIAPAPPGGSASSSAAQEDSGGYYGLVPGRAPDTAAAKESSVFQNPEMTPRPGWSAEKPAQTGDDLRWKAISHSLDKDGDGIPDEIEAKLGDLLKGKDFKPSGRRRFHGMLSGEYAAKKTVDSIMMRVKDKKISKADRKKAARDGYKQLMTMAAAFQYKKAIPAKISQKMGIPEIRMKESQEENDKALDRLNAAIKELKDYQ